jgi:hypothetical protein
MKTDFAMTERESRFGVGAICSTNGFIRALESGAGAPHFKTLARLHETLLAIL